MIVNHLDDGEYSNILLAFSKCVCVEVGRCVCKCMLTYVKIKCHPGVMLILHLLFETAFPTELGSCQSG